MVIKSTKVIKEMRINKIMSMLVLGRYRWEIISELSDEWKCSPRNVEKYMAAVTKLLRHHYSKETADDIQSKYNFLYNKALMSGDDKLAVKILDSQAKVGGYMNDKLEVSVNVFKTSWGNDGDKDTTI